MQEPVLILDDDPVVLTILQQMLSMAGRPVVCASSAQEGLELVRQQRFLMVITDVVMPGMCGLEFQRRVRVEDPEMPIVVITGQPSVATAVEALRDGAANFITKPLELQEILDIVDR